jgi:hypothetical protein
MRTGGAAALTTKLTLSVFGLPVAPGDVMVTVPLYVPAANPAGFTATPTVADVLPLAGVADSHVPPEATAVKLNAAPLEVTETG